MVQKLDARYPKSHCFSYTISSKIQTSEFSTKKSKLEESRPKETRPKETKLVDRKNPVLFFTNELAKPDCQDKKRK